MPIEPTPTDLPDDDLIAFLDGELEGSEAEAIEERIANEVAVRNRAEEYKKSYRMLDYLPSQEPSATFTNQTLTRINWQRSTTIDQPIFKEKAPRSSFWFLALSMILSLVLGVAAHAGWQHLFMAPVSSELSLEELRLIEQLPLSLGVDSLSFLLQLEATGLFEDNSLHANTEAAVRPLPPRSRETLVELFDSYSLQRRAQLRQLDSDLQSLAPERRAELLQLMQNYAVWLDRLPDHQRAEVLVAYTQDRIETIRRIWEQHWREQLPKPMRDRLNLVANDEERLWLVESFKAEEQQERNQWQLARRQWKAIGEGTRQPWPFNNPELAKEVERYVVEVLDVPLDENLDKSRSHRLGMDEIQELRLRAKAAHEQGEWFLYGLAIHRAADQHPTMPKPRKGTPIVEQIQLPNDFLKAERSRSSILQASRRVRGEWPGYALSIVEGMRNAGITDIPALGPSTPNEMSPEIESFLNKKLLPQLSEKEKKSLKSAQGRWPDFPKQLIDECIRHDVSLPGVMLPGPPSDWERFYTLRH